MRIHVLVPLTCWLVVAAPAAAYAQATTQPPAKPPVAAPPVTAPAAPAAPPAPEAEAEALPSLFDQTWRQVEFGGRLSSVSGDPARWQRYQDLRDGVLFTNARFAREGPEGAWLFQAGADNVGWRDQRFFADYERTGKFVVSGLWDQIPQFYSVDTRTPYVPAPGDSPLLLDDATQRSIENKQATLSAWIPIATQFDLRERRDIGSVNLVATPTPQVDVKASFTTQRHVGELPWGASFGFGNDVEVALPYDSRTNDFSLGTEWTNGRNMVRVAYDGSWFDNLDDTLVWDSPVQLNDTPTLPGRGRTALWPTNSAQTISAAGYTKLARRTQVTGSISLGFWNNDSPLLPFTINPLLPQLALPRETTDGAARVFSTNLNFVSRPATDWRVSARVRHYGYDNNTPHASIPEFINYDTSVKVSSTGGPEPYAHGRTTFDADATWSGLTPVAMTVGYSRYNTSHDFRIFDDTGENVLRLTADAVGTHWLTFRAQYELGSRTGSGLNEDLLVQIGEQPALRHYDVANRSRNRFTGQVDVLPNEFWTFSASTGVGSDDYDDSYFGLQESTFRTYSLGADYGHPSGFGAGVSYNYERYFGLQQSRSANPGQETDPNRDWTTDSTERVDYISLYARPPRLGSTEARFSYDYSYAKGKYVYGVVPGGPLPPPSQLPNVFNKLQQLHVDVRHRLSNRLAATFSYLYEPFRVYDFAFDPTVVNSIVQPSSLVLGYVYRPYTAHAVNFGLRYFW
jgi:MtrB/PioB family decaheme-associated outer membrane protein